MSEELRRRLLHMDQLHSEEDRKEVVSDFLQKMSDSGYGHPARKETIISAVRKYYRMSTPGHQ